MPTNAEIQSAFFHLLSVSGFSHPISWPGIDFTTPTTGYWIESSFFPNVGDQPGLAYDSAELKQGLFQVDVYTRPGSGEIALQEQAQIVADAFPRGTFLIDRVRIIRAYLSASIKMDDRIFIPVTIEYTG